MKKKTLRTDITPAELAKELGVTLRTIRRWYQTYRFLTPPHKAAVRGSRGGPRASWPNRNETIELGRRVLEMQKQGATVEAVESAILKDRAEAAIGKVKDRVSALVDRILAGPDLILRISAVLEVHLAALEVGDDGAAARAAMAHATDRDFLYKALLLPLVGYQAVCVVRLPDLSLSVMPANSLAWLASPAATENRYAEANEEFGARLVVAFSVDALFFAVARSLGENETLHPAESNGRLSQAPLVWAYRDDGTAMEFQLAGSWNGEMGYVLPARRFVPASEVALFRVPEFPRPTVDNDKK